LPPLGDVKNRLHLACKVCNQIFGIKHFLVSFTEDLSYLAIVVKNVKEKYGKNYRLQKRLGLGELHLHLLLFFIVSLFLM